MIRKADYWMSGREPVLAEMLSDPIVHLVMRRDGISEADVRAAVRRGRAGLLGGAFAPRQGWRKSA